MKRSDAKAQIEQWNTAILHQFMNTPMSVKIDTKASFEVIITEIGLQSITAMANKPDKRKDNSGKDYTPAVMRITTNAGVLYFVIEDTTVAAIKNGFVIRIGATSVEFRKIK